MAAPDRPVSIIVLCWNQWAMTERCLASLSRNTSLARAEVVVDNGSTDETPEKLRGIEGIRVVRNPSNLGFVRGNNVGLRTVAPDRDVILLNNDIEVLEPGWLDALAETAHASEDVGIVGCRLRMSDGRLLHAGTYILPDTCWGQQIGSCENDVNQYSSDRDVQGIVFACAYIRREVLDAIGPLSEDFESYFEDTDYCLRAARAGFRTVCCGRVTMVHHEHGSTRDSPREFERIFSESRRTFRRKWKNDLDARYSHRLLWQSVLNFPTGYAMSSQALIRSLEESGVRMSYRYVYGKGSPFPVDEPEGTGDYLLNVVHGRRTDRRPDVGVVYGQGDVFSRNRARYRVGYTMLEVDGFPSEWVLQANEQDEVWTPTSFNRDAMIRCGVKRPVHVMPLGVDVEHFHPEIRGFPSPDGDFVFLSAFEWGERKAPELLLSVFNAVFRARDPVVLICKVNHRDGSIDVARRIEALRLKPWGGRIAFLYNRELPYHQLASLYRSADCYVSAGRGEGWDMPLIEAMACGLPAIATDWGAHRDFAHEGISYPLRIRGTSPAVARCPYYEGFFWADPDPDHLASLLRHVYENRDEASDVGRRAAVEVRARYSWEAAARRIRDRISAVGN
ncbi:MAG: glycosyltransferase [Deltaproteobacteria bacterium]|nr:glycosyltransferase [Deltaproteobacteria bacterium]